MTNKPTLTNTPTSFNLFPSPLLPLPLLLNALLLPLLLLPLSPRLPLLHSPHRPMLNPRQQIARLALLQTRYFHPLTLPPRHPHRGDPTPLLEPFFGKRFSQLSEDKRALCFGGGGEAPASGAATVDDGGDLGGREDMLVDAREEMSEGGVGVEELGASVSRPAAGGESAVEVGVPLRVVCEGERRAGGRERERRSAPIKQPRGAVRASNDMAHLCCK
jgi:hypothetical protein